VVGKQVREDPFKNIAFLIPQQEVRANFHSRAMMHTVDCAGIRSVSISFNFLNHGCRGVLLSLDSQSASRHVQIE
jgi:hypothetical protein